MAGAMDVSKWRAGLGAGAALLLATSSEAPRLSVIRAVRWNGGSTWVQLAVEDSKAKDGHRTLSRQITSPDLQPLSAQARLAAAESLERLATAAGIELEAAGFGGRAEEPVELRVWTLGASCVRAVAPRGASVAEIRGAVEDALRSAGREAPEGSLLTLVLGVEELKDPKRTPLMDLQEPRADITAIVRPPAAFAELDNDASRWAEALEEAGRCIVAYRGMLGPQQVSQLAEVLQDYGKSLAGVCLGPCTATLDDVPLGLLRQLAVALPRNLEELSFSVGGFGDRGMVLQVLNYALEDLPPRLRKLEVPADWLDCETRNVIRAAVPPGCAVVF